MKTYSSRRRSATALLGLAAAGLVAGCGSQYSASEILAAQDGRTAVGPAQAGGLQSVVGGQTVVGGDTGAGGTTVAGAPVDGGSAPADTGTATGDQAGPNVVTAPGVAPAVPSAGGGAAVPGGNGTVSVPGVVTPTGQSQPGAPVASAGTTAKPGVPVAPSTGASGRPATTGAPASGGAKASTAPKGPAASTKPGAAAGASTAPGTGPAPGPAASTAPGAAPAACTGQGAPLVVGQVGAWSGLVGQSAGNGRTGLAVWANDVNSRGGIACHPVKLYSDDDQSDGSKSSADVNDLIQNKGAQVLVGSFVPIDASAYRSAAESNKVPTIGGDYTAPDWLQSPYLYPVGGSPEAVYTAAMKGAAALGKTKIAILYCVEANACSYGDSIAKKNAAGAGAQIVYETSVSLTQSDFTSQCQNANTMGATMIFYFGDGSSVQRLARSCNNLGYNPLIGIPSLAAIDALRTDANVNKGGLIFGPNVFPWPESSTPAEQAFQTAYAKYAPGVATDAAAATAWSSGKMLEAVVNSLGSAAFNTPITTAMIMQGLGNVKNETLGGLIPPTTYSVNQPNATPVQCGYVATLSNQMWQPQQGGAAQCL